MTLPVANLVRPALLNGVQNGRIDAALLYDTPGEDGGPTVRLVRPAARAWRALTAAARTAGHTLKASGPADSYRPYEVQERIFRQRYTTTPLAGRPSRVWNGVTWWQKPGTAAAAVPGTSNHGWGLAVDVGVELDGDAGTESIDPAAVAWLVANTATFGFSAELQSEPWHWRYVTGDHIPAAVLDYEQGGVFMALTDAQQAELFAMVKAMFGGNFKAPGGDLTWLAEQIDKGIARNLDEIATAVADKLNP